MYPKFELVLCSRDLMGNPTGQQKAVQSDKAEDLDSFLQRYTGSKKTRENTVTPKQKNKKK